jgi:hypothetical protein
MNKQERKLKGIYKFKKRLNNLNNCSKLRNRQDYTYKTTGKPCSCPICSPGKVEDKAKYRYNKFNKNKLDE